MKKTISPHMVESFFLKKIVRVLCNDIGKMSTFALSSY